MTEQFNSVLAAYRVLYLRMYERAYTFLKLEYLRVSTPPCDLEFYETIARNRLIQTSNEIHSFEFAHKSFFAQPGISEDVRIISVRTAKLVGYTKSVHEVVRDVLETTSFDF